MSRLPPQAAGVRWNLNFSRKCMKINKIRFKLRFLRRLEVKLAHLVCLLLKLAKTERTVKSGIEKVFFFSLFSHSHYFIKFKFQRTPIESGLPVCFHTYLYFSKTVFPPLTGYDENQIHMSYIRPNFGFLPQLKELWRHGCPVHFVNCANYRSLFVM